MTSSFRTFDTIQNCQPIAITEQCCVFLSTTSCGREELNECEEVGFAKFVGAALSNRDP